MLDPRPGDYSTEFSTQPLITKLTTLADPEKFIWASIRQLGIHDYADFILEQRFKVSNKAARNSIIKGLGVYIKQADDFYHAARDMGSTTAPLLYYYCYLNLAKALLEISYPKLHKNDESYRHGISWWPSKDYYVNLRTESVSITRRGVWHLLWESIHLEPWTAPNSIKLGVRKLFSLCPEINEEYERAFVIENPSIPIINAKIHFDSSKGDSWIRFSVDREYSRALHISRRTIIDSVSHGSDQYLQVNDGKSDYWTFELTNPRSVSGDLDDLDRFALYEDLLRRMNLFTVLEDGKMVYSLPIRSRVPVRLSQLVVLYSIMFWLGSLVRYDPHSVEELRQSEYWLLIDGFLNQSRIWLLELIEWHLFRTETTLLYSR